ncbi:MAG: TolC family outer membrane protein [Gallionella sp.]|nr:TolC family outer membrane protein [Gallionella sp.]
MLTLLLTAANAHALTLAEAIALAQRNDPTYLASQSNVQVNRARADQAFARRLPQLTASFNSNSNQRDYTALGNRPNPVSERYNSRATQINLTQPLLHVEKAISQHQADTQVSQAEYQQLAAEKNLLLRLAQAWLETLHAQTAILASDSKVRASQQEMELSQKATDKGVMSITERETAQMRHAQALAEQTAAQNEYELKLSTLEQIIGTDERPNDSALSDRLLALAPTPLADWLAQAEQNNPTVLAAQRALEVAEQEVHKQHAGHLPTLDLVASRSQSTQGSGITGGGAGFRSNIDSIGVQLNIPLYSGGEQNAKIGEAHALRDKARYELEAARRTTRLNIKQAWHNWQSAHARQQSGKQTLQATEFALQAATAQRTHGLKADLDVLQAQQQRAEAQRDWHKARTEILLAYLKLKAETGELTDEDVVGMVGE